MANIFVTVKDYTKKGGRRPEDMPGYDADRAVIQMVNKHRKQAEEKGTEDAAWEQCPPVPEEYQRTEQRIAMEMLMRMAMGLPALVLSGTGFLPEWAGLLTAGAAGAWAIAHGGRARA